MARSKTGSFWLRETITIPANSPDTTRIQSAVDLGSYIDVANSIGLAVEQIDAVYQVGTGYSNAGFDFLTTDGCVSWQLTDLNPQSAFVRADDNSLVGSGAMNIDDSNNVVTAPADFYPDNYGKLDESFICINTNLYVVGGVDCSGVGAVGGSDVFVTVMIKARLAKIEKADWIALAIQNTASV